MKVSNLPRDGHVRRGPDCLTCGSPTGLPWANTIRDGVEAYCALCQPEIKRPKVTLFGRPDGQDMWRWT